VAATVKGRDGGRFMRWRGWQVAGARPTTLRQRAVFKRRRSSPLPLVVDVVVVTHRRPTTTTSPTTRTRFTHAQSVNLSLVRRYTWY